MTIQVQAPNGDVVQFPDGTSDDVMAAAMAREYSAAQAQPTPAVATSGVPSLEGLVAGWQSLSDSAKQAVYDFIAQTVGTTGGIVGGGLLGGPPGAIAGGAAGNVAGKQLSRRLAGAEPPALDSGETALDAIVGGAGPALGSALRVATRAASGLSRAGVTEVEQAGKATLDQLGKMRTDLTRANSASLSEAERLAKEGIIGRSELDVTRRIAGENATELADRIRIVTGLMKTKTAQEVQLAVNTAIENAGKKGIAESSIHGGAIGALIGAVEPITGALLGAGAERLLVKHVLPSILQSKAGPGVARYILSVGKSATAGDIAASLSALAATKGIEPAAAAGLQAIADDLTPPEARSAPRRASAGEPPRAARDAGGRFVSHKRLGPSDPASLREMFPDLP